MRFLIAIAFLAASLFGQSRSNRFEVLPTPTLSATGEIWMWDKQSGAAARKFIWKAPDAITADYSFMPPADAPTGAGQAMLSDGAGGSTWGAPGICGSDTQVIFNDSGSSGCVPEFTFIKGDVCDRAALERVRTDASYDAVLGYTGWFETGDEAIQPPLRHGPADDEQADRPDRRGDRESEHEAAKRERGIHVVSFRSGA